MHNNRNKLISNLAIGQFNIQGGICVKSIDSNYIQLVNSFDIVSIQETWLTEKQSIQIDGYDYFRNDRKKGKGSKRGHGGLVIFFKQGLKNGLKKICSKNPDTMWVKLDKTFFGLNNNLYIVATYIPPSDSIIHKTHDIFNTLNNEIAIYSQLGDVMIIGDLNSRISNKTEEYVTDFVNESSKTVLNTDIRYSADSIFNTQGKKLMHIINDNHMTVVNGRTVGDLDGHYTCVKYNGHSVVDYCIVSNNFYSNIVNFTVKDISYLSDHCPISCRIKCDLNVQTKKTVDKAEPTHKYIWDNTSKEKFAQELYKTATKEQLKIIGDANSDSKRNSLKILQDIILKSADASLKKVKCKKQKKQKFIFSNECRALKKSFNCKLRLYNKDKKDQNRRIELLIEKKKYCRAINFQRRLSKEQNINKLRNMEKKNPKMFWKSIKGMTSKQTVKVTNISEKDWVNHFSNPLNRPTNNSNQFHEYVKSCLHQLENLKQVENSQINRSIELIEIEKCIKTLKNNKAAGIDLITNEMIKTGVDLLKKPLQVIFNEILSSGEFPKEWECSLVTPLHKSGNIDDPQNYRGIAVSNCISKLFVKILTNRIDEHMSNKGLWSKYQKGFKQDSRTEDNLFILKTVINQCTNINNETLYTCFVDFSKYFDTINRKLLFYKLIKYGISGNIYNTIKSMYTDSQYAVKVNNIITESFLSKTGVKQGCPLSPLLSNLFQNDLHEIFDESCEPIVLNKTMLNSLSWADDLVLMSKSPTGLQNCLNKLAEYCSKWDLCVNIDKTKSVTFGKGKVPHLTYNNIGINNVDQYTYLGVCLHKSGKIKYAIEDRIKKAARAINMIQGALSTTGNVSVGIAMSIFDKQIMPILKYGSIIWGISGTYDKLYIKNIPETISNLSLLKEYLKCNKIISQRRVGRKGSTPRNILVTVDSYNTKIFLSQSNLDTANFDDSKMSDTREKLHTKYCKFALGINKFASNHGVRAELGRFPIQINTDIKLLKYWYRLENNTENEILSEAYNLCKHFNHAWYSNIANFLSKSGIAHLIKAPNKYSEFFMVNEIKRVCEGNYIQSWDEKSKGSKKLSILHSLKKVNYKCSGYLNDIENIELRRTFTKLRLGCSKLKSHMYLKFGEENKCNKCGSADDSVKHLLLQCDFYKEIRAIYIKEIEDICPSFKNLSDNSKVCSLLTLTPPGECPKEGDYSKCCRNLVHKLYKDKFI